MHVLNVVEIGRALIIEGRWEGRDAEQSGLLNPFFQVLTIRDSRIVEMQDCVSQNTALRYAKSRAA
ncbi:MAG TPA: hypothetical protein VLK79_07435 [Gaiellales bacterium]|nr:hypothetical protein [Gaiellales bacterium]